MLIVLKLKQKGIRKYFDWMKLKIYAYISLYIKIYIYLIYMYISECVIVKFQGEMNIIIYSSEESRYKLNGLSILRVLTRRKTDSK